MGGMNIPGPLQTQYLKNYCETNGINFMLPIEDYIYDKCYIEFFNILDLLTNNTKYEGILTFSIFCLPKEKQIRKKIYDFFLKNKKTIIFAFEKIHLKNKIDINFVEQIINLKKQNNKSIETQNILKNEYINSR